MNLNHIAFCAAKRASVVLNGGNCKLQYDATYTAMSESCHSIYAAFHTVCAVIYILHGTWLYVAAIDMQQCVHSLASLNLS